VTKDIPSLELSNKLAVRKTNKKTGTSRPTDTSSYHLFITIYPLQHRLGCLQPQCAVKFDHDEMPVLIECPGVWDCIRLEYTSVKQVNSADMERALRRVFSSTTVSGRIVIVGKAAATNIVALVYVPNGYICIAKEEQVELFRKIGALCANNKEEFIPVITFDQEPGEDIEEFFSGNAAVIEDNSEGAEFGDELPYAFDKEPVAKRYLTSVPT
jgi:hypothetical protein